MYYDTTLQEAFARGVKSRPNDLPITCKQAFILGRYLLSEYNGVFYSKSQNLARELRKAYDKVLQDYDVLLMPTIPKKAMTFPSPDPSLEGKFMPNETFITLLTKTITTLSNRIGYRQTRFEH